MVEFRFTAEKLNGQTLIGSLTAVSSLEGKKKITRLAEKNQLKIRNIEKKSTFLYRVRKGKDQPFRGEQKAFTKKEVEDALSRLGYEVLNVNKKLIDFQATPDEKPGHAEYAEQTQAPSQCGPKHPNISQRGACDYQCGNRLATHRTLDQPVRKRRPRSAEYQNDGRGIVKPPRAQQMPTPGERNGQDRQQHQGYSIGFRGHAQRREHPENNRRPGALALEIPDQVDHSPQVQQRDQTVRHHRRGGCLHQRRQHKQRATRERRRPAILPAKHVVNRCASGGCNQRHQRQDGYLSG